MLVRLIVVYLKHIVAGYTLTKIHTNLSIIIITSEDGRAYRPSRAQERMLVEIDAVKPKEYDELPSKCLPRVTTHLENIRINKRGNKTVLMISGAENFFKKNNNKS